MENNLDGPGPELGDDLCQLYQEAEKFKAIQLELCDAMLATENRGRREWIQLTDSSAQT